MKFKHSPVAMAVFATAGFIGAHRVALAQPAAPAPVAPAQLERVEVTGSAIKRIDAETALPVQIISREDIARTGVTTSEQLLRTITAIDSPVSRYRRTPGPLPAVFDAS